MLGAPQGCPEFVAAFVAERLDEKERLLQHLPLLEDLQCAWALLLWSAVPRANHFLRLLPPSVAEEYAEAARRCAAPLPVRAGGTA